MSTEVHAIAQTGFGSGTNELYDRARPSYPFHSLSFIHQQLNLKTAPQPLNIVEIGAGTGIFTRAFIAKLKAVEPSDAMRHLWSKTVNDSRTTIVKGTFQDTGVEDRWADLIIIAQAFHWCPDYGKASTEFARILNKDGVVAFIWNLEDRDGAGWVAQIRDRIELHEKGTPQFRLGLWRQTFTTPEYTSLFHPQEEKEWAYHILATDKIVTDRAQSKSYIAVLPPDQKADVVQDIKRILHRGDGRVWANKEQHLYITLPTRDGTRGRSFQHPVEGSPLGYGHHLAFFHPRNPQTLLRTDGTDAHLCPPEPFTRRMWAAGTMSWGKGELKVGEKAALVSTVDNVDKKGFETGKPMVFVRQRIEVTGEGRNDPGMVEERTHVYQASIASGANRIPRQVHGLPKSQFSFSYIPTPTTLFRFSALTFNGHHIHLDKHYAQKVEGYPERLVHGPLTALMLLESLVYYRSSPRLRTFTYRAHNPIFVNHVATIHGAIVAMDRAELWCESDGVVSMTGVVQFDQ